MESTRLDLYKRVPIPDVARFEEFRKTGRIDRSLYISALGKRMMGKKFDGYMSRHTPYYLFKAMIASSPIFSRFADGLQVECDSPQHGLVEYRKCVLFSYDIKKRKIDEHRSWLAGHYCDWEVADIQINHFPEDLLARFEEIDRAAEEREEKAKSEEEKLYQTFKQIMGLYPKGRDPYSVCSDLKRMWEKAYSFSHRFREEPSKGA